MLTLWGSIAAAVMVGAYALENRSAGWIAVFAVGCLGAAGYAVAVEAWPFAVLEAVWSVVAVRRWLLTRRADTPPPAIPVAHDTEPQRERA